ncbi:FecR family protein [Sphingobacterium suaedae]|uniref:FecR family protein n=1 Tax=Sphingobacterium suaedae TaxID=1686402 RepID=A0ABW5KH78_9SPHI
MAIAVAVVLVLSVLSIGLFVLRQDVVTPPSYRLHVWHTDPGQRLTAKLPDGSTVQLCGESTLWYLVPFDARTVVLHGEGLFEVVRDPAHPFSVKTAKGKVEVLGTSFTVRSYRESAETTVSVLRGLVACTAYGSNGSVHLHPGEAVRFSRQTVSDKVHMPTAEMGLWTQDVLHFDHAPLPQVLADVERWFGVRIHAGTGVDQTAGTFRGTFTSPTIQQVLESICFSLNLRYRLDGHDVYLYP